MKGFRVPLFLQHESHKTSSQPQIGPTVTVKETGAPMVTRAHEALFPVHCVLMHKAGKINFGTHGCELWSLKSTSVTRRFYNAI